MPENRRGEPIDDGRLTAVVVFTFFMVALTEAKVLLSANKILVAVFSALRIVLYFLRMIARSTVRTTTIRAIALSTLGKKDSALFPRQEN